MQTYSNFLLLGLYGLFSDLDIVLHFLCRALSFAQSL